MALSSLYGRYVIPRMRCTSTGCRYTYGCMVSATAFVHMDIFFFVTTVVTVVVGTLVAVLLYYLVCVLKDIRDITNTVKREARGVAADFRAVRTDIREGVEEVRDNVEESITTAQTYAKVVTGTGIVRAVSNLIEAMNAEAPKPRPRSRRRSTRVE